MTFPRISDILLALTPIQSSYTRKSSLPVHFLANPIPLSLGVLNPTNPLLQRQSTPNTNPAAHSSTSALHHPLPLSAIQVHILLIPIKHLSFSPLVSTPPPPLTSGIRRNAKSILSAATHEITRPSRERRRYIFPPE